MFIIYAYVIRSLIFHRKDSFITHRAFCDALAEESARLSAAANPVTIQPLFPFSTPQNFSNPPPLHIWDPPPPQQNPNPSATHHSLHLHHNHHHQPPLLHMIKPEAHHHFAPPPPFIFQDGPPPPQQPAEEPQKGLIASPFQTTLHVNSQQMATPNAATSAHLSATALLQKAATVGAVATGALHPQGQPVGHVTEFGRVSRHHVTNEFLLGRSRSGLTSGDLATWRKSDRLTRDFLGLTADGNNDNNSNNHIGGDHVSLGNGANVNVDVSVNVKDMLTYTGGVEFPPYDQRDHNSLLKPQAFGFAEAASQTWADC